ncbi:MAG: hypothetical protein OXC92_08580 [Flavobacteriaceae bacterium]|nr:hypothetical protein [Flavobacteriaceae bacterium]MCY4217021.1 hypothetical protein [Flavobacteriaceae bacterium]MCY4253680.1 hypothetical protein [Flavobacteriaceae bacterium]
MKILKKWLEFWTELKKPIKTTLWLVLGLWALGLLAIYVKGYIEKRELASFIEERRLEQERKERSEKLRLEKERIKRIREENRCDGIDILRRIDPTTDRQQWIDYSKSFADDWDEWDEIYFVQGCFRNFSNDQFVLLNNRFEIDKNYIGNRTSWDISFNEFYEFIEKIISNLPTIIEHGHNTYSGWDVLDVKRIEISGLFRAANVTFEVYVEEVNYVVFFTPNRDIDIELSVFWNNNR